MIEFNPEAISLALFALLKTSTFSFNAYDRQGTIWTNVNLADQPYLGLIEHGIRGVQDSAIGLTKWTMHFWVLVYIRADADEGATTVPATQLNAALLAIANVIAGTAPGEKQTLGGLVNNCWINGEIFIDTGILDQQCALVIPVDVELGL